MPCSVTRCAILRAKVVSSHYSYVLILPRLNVSDLIVADSVNVYACNEAITEKKQTSMFNTNPVMCGLQELHCYCCW